MKHELVTITSFLLPYQAEMAQGYLESNGIQVFLADKEMSRIAPYLASMMGGIKLQVRPEDAARARELLAEARGGPQLVE